MRKLLLFASFILIGALACFSQTKLGLKFSPLFSSHKISLKSDLLEVSQGKIATRMSIGLIVDHPLTDTYFLSSGLIYLPKRVS
ncbi:PorT family protein, partial [Cyclobacteriaceae bacterium]|nr:PorT family protein [Cyclobacteriaceae bacterium]